MKVSDGDFSGTFSSLTGRWLNDYPGIPVLLSGMIGSEHDPAGCSARLDRLHNPGRFLDNLEQLVP